jgi:hypothetical protein
MECPNCNGSYIPEFIESNHFTKMDNSWYKLYHQECANCHLIIVGIYEFKLSEFEPDSKGRIKKLKFLKYTST